MQAYEGMRYFDGVLAKSTCRYLHTALSLGKLGDEHHTAFDRNGGPATALETALHSVLTALGGLQLL